MTNPKAYSENFMLEALLKASFSNDPNTRVGAVIVDPRHGIVVASGWNSLPKSYGHSIPKRMTKPTKHYWFVHAEENAICNAARMGFSTSGTDIYVTHRPCAYCARKIIQADIQRVFVDAPGFSKISETHGSEHTQQMFAEAGVPMLIAHRSLDLTLSERN